MKKNSLFTALLAFIAAATVGLDQLTKYLAREHLGDGMLVAVPGVLELKLHMNDGASLGILGGERWLLVTVSVVMAIAVAFVVFFVRSFSRGERVTLAFVLGGAIGNLIDRAASGLVTDMLFFPWIGKIPLLPDFVCNVADIAIVLGMFAFVVFFYIADKKRTAAKKAASVPETAEIFPPDAASDASSDASDPSDDGNA